MMQGVQTSKRTLSRALFSISCRTITTLLRPSSSSSSSSHSIPNLLSSPASLNHTNHLLRSPCSAIQFRRIRVSGSDVKVGNVIEKKGRIYQVLKTDHSHEGRGKATIKVELRDIDSGNKVSQRLGTDENVERVFVQEKNFMYMCKDRDGTIVLMDLESFEQLEVSNDVFGKDAMYLQAEMKVTVKLYDEIPLSAQVPKRVTCFVKEELTPTNPLAAIPKGKKVVLDNGLTIEVPPFVVAGDALVINTETDSYIERAKA